MTNPKEKRETLEGRVDAMFPGLNHFSIKIKQDLMGLIKGEIKRAFEETRGEVLPGSWSRDGHGYGYNQALQETIKRQEDYINNL